MGQFSVMEMLRLGWPVLLILSLASVGSWAILIDRCVAYYRAKTDARRFMGEVIRLWRERGPDAAREFCAGKPWTAARAATAILDQTTRAARERALQHVVQAEASALQATVPVLGTVGSMAPFVGLLGTVWGIIRAFRDISTHAGGGPEVVAAGVSEALVTTAAGLLVAIPAVVGYNYCVRQVQSIAESADLAAYDLIEALEDGGIEA